MARWDRLQVRDGSRQGRGGCLGRMGKGTNNWPWVRVYAWVHAIGPWELG